MSAVNCCDPTIDPYVWEPYEASPGVHFMRVRRTKTVPEVLAEIRAIVGDEPDGAEDYLSACQQGPWPAKPGSRLVVFAVNGSNEGDYVHVALVHDGCRYEPLILGKTFAGRDAAWAFARKLADLLGA